jgi:hypothetical protein
MLTPKKQVEEDKLSFERINQRGDKKLGNGIKRTKKEWLAVWW